MEAATEDTPINPEELQDFLRRYSPEHTVARERDVLHGQYRIALNEPLQQFSSAFAKAYATRGGPGDPPAYALVFEPTATVRKKNISALKEYRHPNLLSLLDEGTVEISTLGESRYVVIMERPEGRPLAELLPPNQKNSVSDTIIVNHFIRPFIEILKNFQAMGISHNRINLKNVYIHQGVIKLGECVSEVSGYSQDFIFEPLERLLSNKLGKQDFAINADCYATGMLALHLIIGSQPFARYSAEEFISLILQKGSFHALVIQWDVSDTFQDLFRAILNDAKNDRCTPDYIENWINGRRFNLVMPSIAHETNRGFEFLGQSYLNRKYLSQALFQNWAEAKSILFDTRLPRWLETSLHQKDTAEVVSRIASNNLGDTQRAERHNGELVTRIISVLDPQGPIRYRTLAFSADAVGYMLAHFYFQNDTESQQVLLQVIDNDIATHFLEQQKSDVDYSSLISRLQKARSFLRMQSQGFGIERCIYDFNPTLSCQSTLVKKICVTTLQELLYALDTLSRTVNVKDTDFIDKHVAAFMASKLDISKEIQLTEIDADRELSKEPLLIQLKLLARAQRTAKIKSLPGLSHWVAARLFPLLNKIHRRKIRYKMQRRLKTAADTGSVSAIAEMLLSQEVFVSDYLAFKREEHAYMVRRHLIAKLKNPKERTKHARMVGRGLAQTLAYGTSLFTIYFTLKAYYHI